MDLVEEMAHSVSSLASAFFEFLHQVQRDIYRSTKFYHGARPELVRVEVRQSDRNDFELETRIIRHRP